MRHVTDQIQELLTGIHYLRISQATLLASTETGEAETLPPTDYEQYQRLDKERTAKAQFLQSLVQEEDGLKILLGQLSRLSAERKRLLESHKIDNPIALPIKELKRYTKLWEWSDQVAGMMIRCFGEELV